MRSDDEDYLLGYGVRENKRDKQNYEQRQPRDRAQRREKSNKIEYRNSKYSPMRQSERGRKLQDNDLSNKNRIKSVGQVQEIRSQKEKTINIHPQISKQEIREGIYKNKYLQYQYHFYQQNQQDYLQSQFYLLREDFAWNLRKKLNKIFSQKIISSDDFSLSAQKDMYFYSNVQVTNFNFSRKGLVLELQGYPLFLSSSKKFTTSNRLKKGQLIVLSDKKGEYCIVGYVIYVDTQVDVTFANKHTVKFGIKPYLKDATNFEFMGYLLDLSQASYREGFFGFEPKALWQSYCDPLKEIKKMANNKVPLPFYGWISEKEQFSSSPSFLSQQTSFNMTHICSNETNIRVQYPCEWRSLNSSVLNASEMKALESIITKNMTLVSATPESNKMKLGLATVETLLENWSSWNSNNRPILLVSKSPEVLDSFFQKLKEIKDGKYKSDFEILDCFNQNKKLKIKLDSQLEQSSLFHSQHELDSQIYQTEHFFSKFLTSINDQKLLKGQKSKQMEIFKINIVDLVYKSFLELVGVPPGCENESDKKLIFQYWWSNSIIPQLFTQVSSQQLKQIGQSDEKKQQIQDFFRQRHQQQIEYEELHPKKQKVGPSEVYQLENRNFQIHGQFDDDSLGQQQNSSTLKTYQMRDEEVDFSSCDGQEDQVKKDYLTSEHILSLPYQEFANIRASIFLKRQKLQKNIVRSIFTKYEQAVKYYKEEKWKIRVDEFKGSKVIGGTVADVNNCIEILKRAEYEVVIVIDEAEQILENMLLPLVSPTLKQLVLIGNSPQRIKPFVNNPELQNTNSFGESLFSRLINKGMETFEIMSDPKAKDINNDINNNHNNKSKLKNYLGFIGISSIVGVVIYLVARSNLGQKNKLRGLFSN